MTRRRSFPRFAQRVLNNARGYWNWKCALLSACARSIVYLAAMARSGLHGRLAIILVEMAYVTLTAGLYAGLQQKALGLRMRRLGDAIVVLGIPMLAQYLDWLAHWASGAAAPARATLAVCIFVAVSAMFHLHVMRRGVFLSGHTGHTLVEDFRRIPRLILDFLLQPAAAISPIAGRLARVPSEPAL